MCTRDVFLALQFTYLATHVHTGSILKEEKDSCEMSVASGRMQGISILNRIGPICTIMKRQRIVLTKGMQREVYTYMIR